MRKTLNMHAEQRAYTYTANTAVHNNIHKKTLRSTAVLYSLLFMYTCI